MLEASEPGPSRYRKTIVTEEALRVSPDVLGLTLARPWRRLCAILVDLLLVSILAKQFGVFFAFFAAYVLFRVSFRPTPSGSYLKRSLRFMFRMGGALTLFIAMVILWSRIGDRFGSDSDDDEDRVAAGVTIEDDGGRSTEMNLSPMQGLRFGADMVSLTRAGGEQEARDAATRLLASMRAAGVPADEARATVRGVAEGLDDRPWMVAAIEPVLQADAAADPDEAAATEEVAPDTAPVASADSVILAYGAAISAGDSAGVAALRPQAVALLAADTVEALDGVIEGKDAELVELDEDRDALEERVAALEEELEEGPGVLSFMRTIAEDLGLGLGWFALYFTASTAMWQGRTPGKRLFGIRVISLTGKPIGWWASFERFGGYAAGFATGLLGFMQVLWDDNRQAIHDKIASTAVIREV